MYYNVDPVGGECLEWDAQHSPDECDVDPAPSWCAQRWCAVDPDACDEAFAATESTYFPGNYFIYTTCGGEDSWTGPEQANEQ